jgi:hypothetical protein
MQNTIKIILAAKRKHFLISKPVFHFFAPAAEMDLFMTAQKLEKKLAVSLSQWLRTAGYGDINETLIFRNDYFACISHGALTGCVTFARDEVGNSYAFKPEDGSIYYISLHECAYARISDNFMSFLQELIKRDYNLAQWRETLPMVKDGDD